MKKYKNITNKPELLIGVGVVQPGEVIETDVPVNNDNFELIENEDTEQN